MKKLITLGLAGTIFALVVASSTPAARASTARPTPALVPASALGPSLGGPAPGPYGFKPLHAREFALAKAAANKRAAAGTGSARRRGGGGAPTVSSYANVSPSFNATYQTGVTPPDTTGEAWQADLRDFAEQLTASCRAVDPASTDEMIEQAHAADVVEGETHKTP